MMKLELMALFLFLGAVGCGGGNTDGPVDTSGPPTDKLAPQEEAAERALVAPSE